MVHVGVGVLERASVVCAGVDLVGLVSVDADEGMYMYACSKPADKL